MVDRRKEIEEKIKEILLTQLEVKPERVAAMTESTPLLGQGMGLDSMDALTLAAGLEQRFNVEIPDEELESRHFSSLGRLSDFVAGKLEGR